jgi:hypothetical protein
MKFKIFFAMIILTNICLWFYARPLQARWENVPPAPASTNTADSIGLGDRELAYRIAGLMLQNLGNVDGRTIKFEEYDYAELEKWFLTIYSLDTRSNYVPTLAAYYYGSTQNAEQLKHIINFLVKAGNRRERESWRWLVHGVFLARHKMNDLDLAMELSEMLENHPDPNVPLWARHMSALVKNARGEKEDAYNIMVAILQSSSKDLQPTEVRFIVDYICQQILDESEARSDPICQSNLQAP